MVGEADREAKAMPEPAQLEARLAVLTAFVGGILIEVDAECRYVGVWTGEPELLVRPAEELIGRKVADMVGPEAGALLDASIRRVLASGVPETIDYSLDVVAGRRAFRCLVRPTPQPWSAASQAGQASTVTLFVRDTTEETELKAKLVEAERRAAMGLVAASIGHEIRQPLSFASTSLEVLSQALAADAAKRDLLSRSRAEEALAQVRDALQRIRTIAASVGVVARDRHQPVTTDVRRPALAAVDLCASQLQGRARVTLSVDDLPRVRMNEGQLCQVLTNLLLNAAHATGPKPASSLRIDLRGAVVADGTKVRIDVVDDGCGIDPANVARIFDPFFTTKAPGHGTGLGLFLSKRMIEDAGGSIEIESACGCGTVASITLPIASERAPLTSQTVLTAATGGRPSLLVVDDEAAFLRSLQLVLDGTYELVVCSKSQDALAMVVAAPTRFDVVLCDLSMPLVDGVAFYKQMEALGVASRFVLMTAGAFTPRAESFVRQSRCKRLTKPFAVEELVATVGEVTKATDDAAKEAKVST